MLIFVVRTKQLETMKIVNIGEQNSVLNNFIAELRDARIQKDSFRFRKNLERVGEVFAYEISKVLDYSVKKVTTPLGIAEVPTCDSELVLATVLRAGLPLHQGMLNYFDKAGTAFIAAFRKHGKGDWFKVYADYCTTTALEGKVLILSDAMIASGSSIEVAIQKLKDEGGEPAHIHLACPIASRYAVDYLGQRLGSEITLWVAAIDEELTSHNFIIPGIGDAGDLAFGEKL